MAPKKEAIPRKEEGNSRHWGLVWLNVGRCTRVYDISCGLCCAISFQWQTQFCKFHWLKPRNYARPLNSDNVQHNYFLINIESAKKHEIPITLVVISVATSGSQQQHRLCALAASSQQSSYPTANKAKGVSCRKFLPRITKSHTENRCAKETNLEFIGNYVNISCIDLNRCQFFLPVKAWLFIDHTNTD